MPCIYRVVLNKSLVLAEAGNPLFTHKTALIRLYARWHWIYDGENNLNHMQRIIPCTMYVKELFIFTIACPPITEFNHLIVSFSLFFCNKYMYFLNRLKVKYKLAIRSLQRCSMFYLFIYSEKNILGNNKHIL